MLHRFTLFVCFTVIGSVGSASEGLFQLSQDDMQTYADVGAVALTRTSYLASEEQIWQGLPYLSFKYRGRIFGNPAERVGITAIQKNGFRLAPRVCYVPGRYTDDTPVRIRDKSVTQDTFDLNGWTQGLYGVEDIRVPSPSTRTIKPGGGFTTFETFETILVGLAELNDNSRVPAAVNRSHLAGDADNSLLTSKTEGWTAALALAGHF